MISNKSKLSANAEDEVRNEGDGLKNISSQSKWTKVSFFAQEMVKTTLKTKYGSKSIYLKSFLYCFINSCE